MMHILDNVHQAIGGTPLVRLRRLPGPGNAEVVVKLESTTPGGSIKARSALGIIEQAEKPGLLTPEPIIVEASSGNQGIALAMIGAVKGYQVIVCMPETTSVGRRKVLEACGAVRSRRAGPLVPLPPQPHTSPDPSRWQIPAI